ncbi:unnamed protein product [Spodoptera littoralis]|uniref:Major facilitator superfamily (MFS) profile domain-containing protein n=1 Tax=Spodoptera littoralis TaxID=7109 RepID=A0A9P0HX89_SPOLI|nr:unnamed protein product [Spodoptera littoralis]CAH1635470.1 unnamed protein product [Spodoptera littoralis]
MEEHGESKERVQRAPFETALHHAGYGCFQWLLLMSCGAIYAVCALSTTTLSFVLPAAEYDFHLSSSDKGRLTATPLIGMCVGSYFWGNLADARGRKKAIIGALLLDALAAFLSSVVQSFPAFLACRFFSGFGIIGATGLVFPYFGDFLSLRHRDVMLCRLEVFWTFGTILLPGIAFLIIPDPRFNLTALGADFQYTSWRVFVAACGIPSLLVVLLLIPFPESPRYLLYANRAEQALQVLQRIFVVNTKLSEKDFPVESMISAYEGEEEEVVSADNNGNETKAPLTWAQRWDAFWVRKKMLVTPPYIGLLILCCFVDFGLMFSYYTLMMWFPDLFERFSQFSSLYPDVSAGVCEVSLALANDTAELTVIMMLISSGLAALGLNLVRSSLENLILSCVFEAIVSCTEAVLFCVICEIFPTKVAATAMAVTVMCGRIGAIVGNVIFGALVDEYCIVPIYMFGTLLIRSVLTSIPWGYISSVHGRHKALLIALWGSFVFSFISSFSVHWIMLAVLKVFSASLYFVILFRTVPAYLILQFNFSYDLNILVFTPWRLLTITLAVPLGISAFFLHFYYESPKFLVNVGREELALEYLAKVWARNGRKGDYPSIPLFRKPLLWRTLQLFYLTTIVYSVNNSLVIWMPYIIGAFTDGSSSYNGDGSRSLCSILKSTSSEYNDTSICDTSIKSHTLISAITHGVLFATITLMISKLASRKKLLMILFLFIPALSSLGAVYNQNNMASLVLFLGMTFTNLCMGVLFCYYVEVYPTFNSGMAACLGVMVARMSGLAGVYFLGTFVMTHCTMTLYTFAAYLMSGVLVATLLPPDIVTKQV